MAHGEVLLIGADALVLVAVIVGLVAAWLAGKLPRAVTVGVGSGIAALTLGMDILGPFIR